MTEAKQAVIDAKERLDKKEEKLEELRTELKAAQAERKAFNGPTKIEGFAHPSDYGGDKAAIEVMRETLLGALKIAEKEVERADVAVQSATARLAAAEEALNERIREAVAERQRVRTMFCWLC